MRAATLAAVLAMSSSTPVALSGVIVGGGMAVVSAPGAVQRCRDATCRYDRVVAWMFGGAGLVIAAIGAVYLVRAE